MKMLFISTAMLASVTLGTVMPSQAQTYDDLLFNVTGLQNSCAKSPKSCDNVVAGILGRLARSGLDGIDLQVQIGLLASTLVDIAKDTDDGALAESIEAALLLVAGTTDDPIQAALIEDIAGLVGDGAADDIVTTDPANPSPA